MDQKVAAAINIARSFVSGTNGLAIVYFPEGTFYLNNKIALNQNDRNIVFQGAGSDQTTLVFQNLTNDYCFYIAGSAGTWSSNSDLDQDFSKGDSILHAASGYGLSSLLTGDWVHFVQYNFDYHTEHPGFRPDIVGQITRLEAKGTDATGEWGEIKDVANMNYEDSGNTNYSLKIRKINPVQNIGIEDLRIIRSPDWGASATVYNILFDCAINCWVRGVESYKPSRNHLCIALSSHIIISGCYFHEAMGYGGDGWGYGVELGASTTNCLIENNIFRKLRHALIAGSGSNCNVWAFNYSREQNGTDTSRYLDLHAKYPFGHLFEHNVVEMIGADDYHGDNGPYNTFVRNHSYDGNIELKATKYWSSLGNIFDDSPLNAVWQQYNYPPICDIFGFFNNYTVGHTHNDCHTHFDDQDADLYDVSYYYSSRPNFLLSNFTWPAIGPKISSTQLTQSIPAKSRYNDYKKTYLPNPTPKPLTLSGTFAYSQKWSGNITLISSVTVPSGITLTVEPGATINVPSGKKIAVSGKLLANDATFTSVSGIWYGIEFTNASYNSMIQYCTIEDATVGVHMNNTDIYLLGNDINNNTTGLLFNSGSDGVSNNNQIIYNSSCGVKCTSNSDPLLFSWNVIRDNGYGYGGVYGDATSIFDLGRYSDQGHNSIYYNDQFEVQSGYPGTIYARYNWWGDPNPYPYVTSNVDWSYYLTSDPNTTLAKAISENPGSDAPIMNAAVSTDTIGISEVDYAYLIYRKGDFVTAANLFETIVHKYPTYFSGRRALAFLYKCNKHLSKGTENLTLLDNVSATYATEEIDALAKNIAAGELIKQGDYQAAIARSEAVTNSFVKTEYAKQALFNLGNTYWYFLDDPKTGATYYRQLIAAYPDDDLSISALATLGEWKPDDPKPYQPALTENLAPAKFSLDQNYPNPFNPETTIRYHLAEASRVTIKIYNLLGAEVVTLIDQTQLQGNHAIQWNGRDRFGNAVANGVYWLRLQDGRFIGQSKLVVVR